MILHMKNVICAYCGATGIYDYEPCYKSFMDSVHSTIERAEATTKQCESILREQHENNCVKILQLTVRLEALEKLLAYERNRRHTNES